MAQGTFPTSMVELTKICGGESNVVKIVHQYLKNKQREKENQELLKWAKAQRKEGKAAVGVKS